MISSFRRNRRRVLLPLLLCTACLASAQSGRLEAGDLQLESGEYVDVYERELEAGASVVISIASREIDPYLIVLDPAGESALQVDDSPGHGLDVSTTFTPVRSGTHTIAVTSATAGETGAYALDVRAADAAAPPPAPPAPGAGPFAGSYEGEGLGLELAGEGGAYSGTLTYEGRSFPVTAQAAGDTLTGSFRSDGGSFAFRAVLQGGTLVFETGGSTYALRRGAAPANPLARPPADPLQPAPGAPPLTPPAPAAAPPAPAVDDRGPGYAAGYVRTRDGRPLAGVEIRIEGVNMAGQRISAYPTTGADGRYLTRVPDGLVEVNAYLSVDYHGHRYFIRLAPDDGAFDREFDTSLAGIVRNFTFRFAGLRPGGNPEEPSAYFGGYGAIEIGAPSCCVEEHTVPTGSGVRLTLVPDGPLLDGSAGETLVIGCDACVPDAPSYAPEWNRPAMEFREIPPGRYRVSAALVFPDGTVRPARVGSHNFRDGAGSGAIIQELADSVTVVFPPYSLFGGEPGVGSVTFYVDE